MAQYDYYISPSGNDTTGDGSSGNPWRSLVKAVDSTFAGSDTFIIHCADGSYPENNPSSGIDISFRNITIQGDSGDATIVTIQATNTASGDHLLTNPTTSGSYIVIVKDVTLQMPSGASAFNKCFTHAGSNIALDETFLRVIFDGGTANVVGIDAPAGGSDVKIYHCLFENTGNTGKGVEHNGAGTTTVKNCIITGWATGLERISGTLNNDYNVFDDNTTDYSGTTGNTNLVEDYDPYLETNGKNKRGSVGIDVGVAISGINDSYNGLAPDIGINEVADPPTVTVSDLPQSSNIKGYYKTNDTLISTTVADSSGGGIDLTLSGGYQKMGSTNKRALGFLGDSNKGQAAGGSIVFPGTAGEITIASFVYFGQLLNWGYILASNSQVSATNDAYWLLVQRLESGGVDPTKAGLQFNFNDGSWHAANTTLFQMDIDIIYHVAVTYKQSTGKARFYKNGAFVQELTAAGTLPVSATGFRIGGNFGTDAPFFSTTETIGWNKVLTDSEVQQVYDTYFNTPPGAPTNLAIVET